MSYYWGFAPVEGNTVIQIKTLIRNCRLMEEVTGVVASCHGWTCVDSPSALTLLQIPLRKQMYPSGPSRIFAVLLEAGVVEAVEGYWILQASRNLTMMKKTQVFGVAEVEVEFCMCQEFISIVAVILQGGNIMVLETKGH